MDIQEQLKRIEQKLDQILELNNKKQVNREEVKGDGKLEGCNHGKGFLITGDTLTHRQFLREQGGSWNRTLKGWMFTGSNKDGVLEAIKENNIDITLI